MKTKTHIIRERYKPYIRGGILALFTRCGHFLGAVTKRRPRQKIIARTRVSCAGLHHWRVPDRAVPPHQAHKVPQEQRCQLCFNTPHRSY